MSLGNAFSMKIDPKIVNFRSIFDRLGVKNELLRVIFDPLDPISKLGSKKCENISIFDSQMGPFWDPFVSFWDVFLRSEIRSIFLMRFWSPLGPILGARSGWNTVYSSKNRFPLLQKSAMFGRFWLHFGLILGAFGALLDTLLASFFESNFGIEKVRPGCTSLGGSAAWAEPLELKLRYLARNFIKESLTSV